MGVAQRDWGLDWRFFLLIVLTTPLTCFLVPLIPTIPFLASVPWSGMSGPWPRIKALTFVTSFELSYAVLLWPITLPLASVGFAWAFRSARRGGASVRLAAQRGGTLAGFASSLVFIPLIWMWVLIAMAAMLSGWIGASIIYREARSEGETQK